MNKNTLFWILAIIQGYVIYYAFSTLVTTNNLMIKHVYSEEIIVSETMRESLIFGGLLAISTIWIEYLIYSKLKQ